MSDPNPMPEACDAKPSMETLVSTSEIDASCRWPVLLLFSKGAFWLVVSGLLWLVSAVQLASPAFLDACPWVTVGHLRPASWNVFIYGFLIQAGLGALLWLLARLGNSVLRHGLLVLIAGAGWNAAVLLGLIGILRGDNTSYSWFEFPKYVTPIFFAAYVIIAVVASVNFAARNRREIYVSQWFLLAAVFWFPWIYSTALLLLQFHPVRGVAQVVIDGWFKANLGGVWLVCIALGIIYYIFPKTLNGPLYSRSIANLGFWTTLFLGGWHMVGAETPVPAWVASASSAAAMLSVVPMLALITNLMGTAKAARAKNESREELLFGWYAAASYVVYTLASVWASRKGVAQDIRHTVFADGLQVTLLYGLGAMSVVAAIYHITPRLLNTNSNAFKWVGLHFWLAGAGTALLAFVFLFGGIEQGRMINDVSLTFGQVGAQVQTYYFAAALGGLLVLGGQLLLFGQICGAIFCTVRSCVTGCASEWLGAPGKTVGAKL